MVCSAALSRRAPMPIVACLASLAVSFGAGAAAVEDASPARAQLLTIDELADDGVNRSFDLSPSGRYVASISRIDQSYLVVVSDLETGKVTGWPFPDARLDWVSWASDDRLLVAARFWIDMYSKIVPPAVAESGRERRLQPVLRLFVTDRDGANSKMLLADNRDARRSPDLARVAGFQRKDRLRAVIPAWGYDSLDLFAVDVHTGESKRIAEGKQATQAWFTDRNGDPAFRIDGSVSGKLAFIYARTGPADADHADLQWKKVQTIRLQHSDNQSAPMFYPVSPGPVANTYYVAARPEGADTTGMYLYDYVEQKYLETHATAPGVDIEDLLIEPKTHAYQGASYYAERKVTRFADPALQAHFDTASRALGPDVEVHLEDMDAAQSAWVLYTEGPRDAGSWHLYRLRDQSISDIGRRLPDLDPGRLGSIRVLRYRARDGLEIGGYLTLPAGHRPGDKPPLVMLPHGGPEARDYFRFDPTAQLLASRGYQVFQPNFRGSSGFGRKFAESGYGQWGRSMQDDLSDALDFLVKNGHAAEDRSCIIGGSYGGYAALAAVTMAPDQYRCAVAISGVTHLRQQLKFERRMAAGDEATWTDIKRRMGDPDDDAAGIDARSPAALASAVKVPILLIHGTADDTVPVEQAELMEKALRKAAKDVRLVKVKGMGHSPNRADLKKVYPPILEFLQKHLPVDPSQPEAP